MVKYFNPIKSTPFAAISLFILFHSTILIFYPFHFIDIEALEYGEFAASYLHGFTSLFDAYQFMFLPREGSLFLGTPLIIPFFHLFGMSYFTLNLTGVFLSATFIISWYPVFRKIFPHFPSSYLYLLLAIPLPLIQQASTSIFYIMTHLGALILFGFTIQLIELIKKDNKIKDFIIIIIISLTILISTFYSRSYIVFIPSILYLLYKKGKREFFQTIIITGLLSFSIFRNVYYTEDPSLFPHRNELYSLNLIDTIKASFNRIQSIFTSLSYMPDFQIPHLSHGARTYRVQGLYFYLIIVTIVPVFLRISLSTMKKNRYHCKDLQHSIFITIISFLAMATYTGFSKEIYLHIFDGLRYFTMLVPLFYLFILYPSYGLTLDAKKKYALILVFVNIVGTLLFLYPFKRADFLHNTRGYIGFFPSFLKSITTEQVVSSDIKENLLPWLGVRAYYNDEYLEAKPSKQRDRIYYDIGYNMAKNLDRKCYKNINQCLLKNKTELTIDEVKFAFLLSTPCDYLQRSPFGKIVNKISKQDLLTLMPHAWECYSKIRSKSQKSDHPFIPHIIPFKMSQFHFNKQNVEVYIGTRWLQYLKTKPGMYNLRK